MNKDYHYKAVAHVQNGLGVLARMFILLRKFNVNIQSLDVEPLDDKKRFYNIHLGLDSSKNFERMGVVMRKLERQIHVVKVTYSEITNGLN